MPDQGLHQLVHQGGHRKRHLPLPRGSEPQVEVLPEELGSKSGMEVEVDEGRRFVTGKRRTHNTVVEAVEKGLPADAAPLRENRHLGQRLSHYAEEEVMAELHDAGELAVTDVGGAGA